MNPSKIVTGMLGVAAALAIGGCGSATQSAAPAPTGAGAASGQEAPSAQHNNADVAFAQQMIPHHQQAVAMAELAPQRAGGQPVKQLAADVEAAQQPEIDRMTAMLKAWNAPVPGAGGMSDMPGMDHGSMPGMHDGPMPGMMTEQDMTRLGQLNGTAFDQQFLRMMIEHHQGALTMAATELQGGANPQAKALAQSITASQTAQIQQMRGMLSGS